MLTERAGFMLDIDTLCFKKNVIIVHQQVFFYFSTSPIACTYYTLGNCWDLNISKKNLIIKVSQTDVILVKNISVCQSGMLHEGCWVNFQIRVENLEACRVCWTESTRRVQLCGNQAVALQQTPFIASPHAQSGVPAKKATIRLSSRFCMKLAFSIQVCTG